MQPAGEPPLLEWTACAAYQLLGRESLSIPRALSAMAWVVGVAPLALIALRLSMNVAVIAASLYLFMPYGVVASRAFQPDPLMTSCALMSLYLLVRDYERGTARSLGAAAAAMAVATVVKPMSIFLVVPAAVALAVTRAGRRRAVVSRLTRTLALGLLPAVAVYGWSAVFGSLARDQMHMRFVPSLLGTEFFWRGWLTQIDQVFSLPVFFTGLAGAVFAPERWMRALLASLWAGYLVFALAFTYHVPTHDYYHLPFVGVAALGSAVIAGRALHGLGAVPSRMAVDARAMVVAVVIAVVGAAIAWPRLGRAESDAQLRMYDEIGEACAHNDRVLFLDREYGYPLMYHSRIAGDAWPSADDLVAEQLGGVEPLDAAARFRRDFEDYAPAYFVVTDLTSLERQPDLEAFLRPRTTLVATSSSYRIYRFNRR